MKLYFKVYQDAENCGKGFNFYIDEVENCIEMCKNKDFVESNDPFIFEPFYMDEDEFSKLPEFKGF
jgi:hypothetical protein